MSKLRDGHEGATAVEYAILLTFIAAVLVGVVTALGLSLPDGFQQVVDGI